MFQSNPGHSSIGPVRSARWPNIHTTYMFDGVLACSGGSDGIRYLLKNEVGFPYLDADTEDPHSLTYFFQPGGQLSHPFAAPASTACAAG